MVKVLHFVSKMDRAGQETFLMNALRNIDREKVEFSFLCTVHVPGDYDNEIMQLGGKLYYLPKPKQKNGIKRVPEYIDILVKWLQENENKFDIVHLHTYHNLDVFVHLEACRRAGIKNIIIHSHNTSGPHKITHKALGLICRHFYKFERFACSDEAGVWLFGKKAVKQGKVKMIPNGIDFAKYTYDPEKSEAKKRELGIAGKIVLGHIGRFSAQKNHKFLIEVFYEYQKINSNSVLLLVGRGELEEQIKKQVHDLGLDERVKFLGVREDVPELLQAMDVFVFPSLYEGLGIVLIEAQVAKVPTLINQDIPDEATVSNGVKGLPINDSKVWVHSIVQLTKMNRHDIILYDRAMAFDITNVVLRLREYYFSRMGAQK